MAARWMQQKAAKLKVQSVALMQHEMTKACYFTSKPEVPAYDPAMVRRVDAPKKRAPKVAPDGAIKRRYVKPAAPTLVQTGIGTVGSWANAGAITIVKRAR